MKEVARSGTNPHNAAGTKGPAETEAPKRQAEPMTIGALWDSHYYPDALH